MIFNPHHGISQDIAQALSSRILHSPMALCTQGSSPVAWTQSATLSSTSAYAPCLQPRELMFHNHEPKTKVPLQPTVCHLAHLYWPGPIIWCLLPETSSQTHPSSENYSFLPLLCECMSTLWPCRYSIPAAPLLSFGILGPLK